MAFSILVCVKAVPDRSTAGTPTADGREIDASDPAWCMNGYDAYALEAALAIKDAHPDTRVDALSAGPDGVRPVIRRAMAMGADTGVQLVLENTARAAPEPVATAIAPYARSRHYDLILTGAVSEDLMQGVTGPMIAAELDWPCAAAAVVITPDIVGKTLDATCEMEGGLSELIRLTMPALVTVQTGGASPRYPSLSNTLRSLRQSIERVIPNPTEALPPALEFVGVALPRPAPACRVIRGTALAKADALLALFSDKGWLK